MKRKIVQISAVPETEYSFAAIYVLADDGSLWCSYSKSNDPNWYQYKALPDKEEAEKEIDNGAE